MTRSADCDGASIIRSLRYVHGVSQIELLERRVSALEQEVEGEKIVTRSILEQVRRNSDDLAALRGDVRRLGSRMDAIESRLDAVEARLSRLEQELRSLRSDLPRMIAETMREVLAERDARR